MIQRSDVDKAARVLSRSLVNYPMFTYIFPDDTYRGRKIRHLFCFIIQLGLLNGEVVSPSEEVEGVSIWIRSQNENHSITTAVRAGLLKLLFHVGLPSVSRLIQIGTKKSSVRRKLLSQPYCLLDMIGVTPSLQRHGFGRKMLEEKLSELDNEHIPCYLETSKTENMKYYQQFGFKLIHEYQLPAMPVLCLLR
jgi:ribosomal protein S18 acetylase RimI-like enzyme